MKRLRSCVPSQKKGTRYEQFSYFQSSDAISHFGRASKTLRLSLSFSQMAGNCCFSVTNSKKIVRKNLFQKKKS